MKPSKLFASNVSLLFWRIPLEKLVDEDNDDGDDDDDDDDDNDDDDDEDDVEVDNDENDDDNKARNVCLLDNHSPFVLRFSSNRIFKSLGYLYIYNK